jgi:hypothetical protein
MYHWATKISRAGQMTLPDWAVWWAFRAITENGNRVDGRTPLGQSSCFELISKEVTHKGENFWFSRSQVEWGLVFKLPKRGEFFIRSRWQ